MNGTKRFKLIGFSIIGLIIFGLLFIINFGWIYYFYSMIDFKKNYTDRVKVVEMIKTEKLKDFTYKRSANWMTLPDSLIYLSDGGNVRIEMLDKKLSVFFYKGFRYSEDPIGFAYFDSDITKDKLMNIDDPNSFFFRDKWVKRLNPSWYYIEYLHIRTKAP